MTGSRLRSETFTSVVAAQLEPNIRVWVLPDVLATHSHVVGRWGGGDRLRESRCSDESSGHSESGDELLHFENPCKISAVGLHISGGRLEEPVLVHQQ